VMQLCNIQVALISQGCLHLPALHELKVELAHRATRM
jgi:hypothetical protein